MFAPVKKFSRLCSGLLLCIAGFAPALPVDAAPSALFTRSALGDQALLAAYDAFRAGNPAKFARAASSLGGHVLSSYLAYWRLGLQLEEATPEAVQAVLAQYPDSYAAERLRAEWLRLLGKRRDWPRFDAQRPLLVRDDAEIRCYGALSGVTHGDSEALDQALKLWVDTSELPPGCVAMADELKRLGLLGPDPIWRRARMLFANGQAGAARAAISYLPKSGRTFESQLAMALGNPERLIASLPSAPSMKTEDRHEREIALFAGLRIGRDDQQALATALAGRLGAMLNPDERAYLWAYAAWRAAMRHDERALEWYAMAGKRMSDEQLAWKARAALRAANWRMVKEAIDDMSADAQREPAWIYWYGRALASEGNGEGARAYYLRISGGTDFYGLLALEELGYAPALPAALYQPGEEEVAAVARREGLARALELFRLGLRPEAVREWIFTVRALDDRQLLAAAELARRAELYDRAIATADRTLALHNFNLRYPAPYREVFGEFARAQGLDEAFVLGIARQESRFIATARSVAGAQGLMQLMPATARWVAQKSGLRDFSPGRVVEIKTNVTLGTRYLKLVLDSLGHPALAAAAYNAGPGRARRWRATKPLEGAVYAESIPFNETRDYVKKVMANAAFYGALLEGRPLSLKQRLAPVAARDPGERSEQLP